jgi:hypothetical protein
MGKKRGFTTDVLRGDGGAIADIFINNVKKNLKIRK